MFGGTGQVAPWRLLADYDPGIPLILAGGLTPENVTDAIFIVRPYAVDVASGIESSPGKKDFHKLRKFVDAVRNTSLPGAADPL
jgi:phosphoribosylanthranilate isomerase